jgi:hypothetical protein
MYMRGLTRYSMRRPDVSPHKLTVEERMYGGMPNSGDKIKLAHAMAIQTYVDRYVGGEHGDYHPVVFNRTLTDWMRFDISDREHNDASISSGLALFAAQKHVFDREVNNSITKEAIKEFYKIK